MPEAIAPRISGGRQHEDYDVLDSDREVGLIYLVDSDHGRKTRVLGAVGNDPCPTITRFPTGSRLPRLMTSGV
jgi:hypothetical protein